MAPHPPGAAKGHHRGSQVPYSGGGTVPVCPASSSPALVGAGTLCACWWWNMWVPPSGTGCPPSQRRGAMGDPLPCCAEDLLEGVPSSPTVQLPSPPTCVLLPPNGSQVLFPSVPRLGRRGGVSSCCFPLPLRGLDPSIQTLPAGRLAALGSYLPRLQGRLTPGRPPKKQGVLLALVHRAATIPLTPLGAADHLEGSMSLPLHACCPHLGVVFCRGSPGRAPGHKCLPRALGHRVSVPP